MSKEENKKTHKSLSAIKDHIKYMEFYLENRHMGCPLEDSDTMLYDLMIAVDFLFDKYVAYPDDKKEG